MWRIRSWVRKFLDKICVVFGPSVSICPIALRGFGSGKPPRVQLDIENQGRTAARDLVVGGVCVIEPHTISGDLLFPGERIMSGEPMTLPGGARIQCEILKRYPPSEDEFRILRDGSWRLCAFVILSYRDVCRRRREKRACFEVKIDFAKGWRSAGEFSAAFDEVPIRSVSRDQPAG